jgi:hypothetical protein
MLTLMVSHNESPSTRAILRHLTFPPGGTKALTYYNSVIKLQERIYFRHLRFGIIILTSDNPALDLLTIQSDLLSKPVDPIFFKEQNSEMQIYINSNSCKKTLN